MVTEKEILENLEKGILISPDISEDNNKIYFEEGKAIKYDDIIFLKKYEEIIKKRSYNDFFKHFLIRYKNIESLLRRRSELKNLTSISRIDKCNERDNVSVIAMIKDKKETQKGNIILTVEDPTGEIKVLVSKNSKIYNFAKNIVLDEVLGINGTIGKEIIFSNLIIYPDIPYHELKKHPEEIYAAFIGDIHFGSKVFLESEFIKMIKWINGEIGTDQHKEIAKKIKYIFIIGDLVEGVGIYPNQEKDLDEKFHDIKNQYNYIIKLLKQINKDKKIIICPGNHDYGRIAEPQLPLTSKYSIELTKMKNVTLVSNPAFLNFARTKDFPGFNLLMYHGGSLIYYCENVPEIRKQGGQKAVHLAMKFLLQRRHLAPTHGSTLYIPDPEKDFLFIDTVPDFFITGHIHRSNIDSYKNVTLINSSCWSGLTDNQIKRGLEPQPGKLPVINLNTREIKLINFLKKRENKDMDMK